MQFPYAPNILPMMLVGDEASLGMLDPQELQHSSPDAIVACLSVADENNQNLTTAEKELLTMHCRFGHANFGWIQSLLSSPRDGSNPVLPCKHRAAATSSRKILCTACNLGKATKRTTSGSQSISQHPDPIRAEDLQPGDCVSVDLFQSPTPGRTLKDRSSNNHYTGGAIFCDHATSLIYISNQVSLKGGETTMSKRAFEQWAKEQNVPRIQAYRAENKPFGNNTFQADIDRNHQEITFSGVGAHHQNGVAERSIRTITSWARTMLLHQVLHWPDQADLSLWPFALEHAAYIWNRLPRKGGNLSPLALFTRIKDPAYASLTSLHVWGCPTYVLDPTLQDGKKLPKWKPRARRGMYLGVSSKHSTNVTRIYHTETKNVSSQFHVVCDDQFSTVSSPGIEEEQFSRKRWDSLIESGYEFALDEADESDDNGLVRLPILSDDWLDLSEKEIRAQRRRQIQEARLQRELESTSSASEDAPTLQSVPPPPQSVVESVPPDTATPRSILKPPSSQDHDSTSIPQLLDPFRTPGPTLGSSPSDPPRSVRFDDATEVSPLTNPRSQRVRTSVSEGATSQSQPSPPQIRQPIFDPNNPRQATRQRRLQRQLTQVDEESTFAEDLSSTEQTQVPQTPPPAPQTSPPRVRRSARLRNKGQQSEAWIASSYLQTHKSTYRCRFAVLNAQFVAALRWEQTVDTLQSHAFAAVWEQMRMSRDVDEGTQEWMHPLALAAKTHDADNPSWEEAMNGPLADGYMRAAEKEIETLEKMEVWDVIPREAWMNVLPSTWAFKCKRFPADGSVRKLKGRFCVRSDRQIDGVNFDSTTTNSPVVGWDTIRLMLILSVVLELQTKQVDYTAAFVHAPIGEMDVFVDMPRGFSQPGRVLKLKKSLYGLKQAPKNFYSFIRGKLEESGFRCFEQVDRCLFMSDRCICLVYVDDTLFFSPEEKYIDQAIQSLRNKGVQVEIEDSVAGFLEVHIDRDKEAGSIKLTQSGLTKRIIDALNLEGVPTKETPAAREPLAKDPDGDPADATFSYASVVGMLLYLAGHSRPDIQYAVSQCARFVHSPRRSHEKALVRIGQYLKGTIDCGLTLRTSQNFDLKCFVDAGFAGLYSQAEIQDPSTVKSRTGYAITVADCPILWVSKMQTDIALSTMEAEYNALSTCMRDLLPLRTLFATIGNTVGLSNEVMVSFKTTVFEDNQGCLKLARMEPGQYTPRSKHYAVKYHWFRSKLKPNSIEIENIQSSAQKADILTKGLPPEQFRKIRLLL